jgi:hypothetical protein
VTLGAGDVAATGRSQIGVHNVVGSTVYRYVRLMTDVGGTTPSINFTAFLAKN